MEVSPARQAQPLLPTTYSDSRVSFNVPLYIPCHRRILTTKPINKKPLSPNRSYIRLHSLRLTRLCLTSHPPTYHCPLFPLQRAVLHFTPLFTHKYHLISHHNARRKTIVLFFHLQQFCLSSLELLCAASRRIFTDQLVLRFLNYRQNAQPWLTWQSDQTKGQNRHNSTSQPVKSTGWRLSHSRLVSSILGAPSLFTTDII
jgi:hypothetical protein